MIPYENKELRHLIISKSNIILFASVIIVAFHRMEAVQCDLERDYMICKLLTTEFQGINQRIDGKLTGIYP